MFVNGKTCKFDKKYAPNKISDSIVEDKEIVQQ